MRGRFLFILTNFAMKIVSNTKRNYGLRIRIGQTKHFISMTNKTFFSALCLSLAFGFVQETKAQNDYFVTTDVKVVAGDSVSAAVADMTPEQRFLNDNFPYRSLCDWTEGMRFMVLPGERDAFLNIFADAETQQDVPTGELKKHIVVYKGHEITDRGWIRLHFEVFDTHRRIYHEVRNFSFSDYCQKNAGGGVPALAYLDEVDKAKELMMGKTYYSAHEVFYKDDRSSQKGYREHPLPIDTKLTVTAVGVGTREYPVKIVVTDPSGQKYFQLCALSHTNSGMNDNEFIAGNEQHLFDKSFAFKMKYATQKDRTKADPTKDFSALPKTGPTSPTNTRYVNYAGLVSGLAEKGQTKDMISMSKGQPDKKWTTRNGSVVWWYADGTEITFSKKGIVTKVSQSSNPSGK